MSISRTPSLTAADALRIDLREQKLTAKAVAKDLGVHPAYLSRVVNGHTRSGRIRSALARRFGRHYLKLLRPWSDHGEANRMSQSGAGVQ